MTTTRARTPHRVPRVVAPLVTGGVVGLSALAVVARSPHQPGAWGTCPWLALTGTFCPGCGGLRAVHDAGHLDLVGALSNNAVVVLGGVLAVVAWGAWLRSAATGRTVDWGRWVTPRAAYGALALLLTFTVVRNVPLGAWFAPAVI